MLLNLPKVKVLGGCVFSIVEQVLNIMASWGPSINDATHWIGVRGSHVASYNYFVSCCAIILHSVLTQVCFTFGLEEFKTL